MKKFIVAAILLAPGSAAYAAAPDTVSGIANACCSALAACCQFALGCCA